MERINISNRTKAALARLKAEGVDLGNLTNLAEVRIRGHETIKANADKYAKDIKDIIEGIKLSGIKTFQGIADAFLMVEMPSGSEKTRRLNEDIFESSDYGAVDATCESAPRDGLYESYVDCSARWEKIAL